MFPPLSFVPSKDLWAERRVDCPADGRVPGFAHGNELLQAAGVRGEARQSDASRNVKERRSMLHGIDRPRYI